MTPLLTLSDLTQLTGLDVLDHLDRSISVPISGGLQAQGDLLVIPMAMIDAETLRDLRRGWNQRMPVPRDGVELLRSTAGGNPHTLTADELTCTWSTPIFDEHRLALGIVDASSTAYLIHPEHGATGIAPGTYLIRRQRESGGLFGYGRTQFVAD